MTVGEFMYVLRKHFKTKQHEAVFMFINNRLVNSGCSIQEIHNDVNMDKECDGFIYVTLSCESTFG